MTKIWQKFKYPKFFLLLLTFVVAYLLFQGQNSFLESYILNSLGYGGIFLAGAMFAYGFTAAPATAIFLIAGQEYNIFLAGIIGGLGSLVGDLLIFKFIRHSFRDEITKISEEKILVWLHLKTPNLLKKYLVPVIAGLLIASPLPDELGVSLLSTQKLISTKVFAIIAFLLNTIGIFLLLLISQNI